MKKNIIILLLYCVTIPIRSQSIINQIETFYFQLDSVSYLKSLENAIIESVIRDFQEPLESHIQWKYNQIKNGIADKNIKFVLNIEIDITKLESDTYDYIKIDTSRYNFNVYCFNKRNFPVYYDRMGKIFKAEPPSPRGNKAGANVAALVFLGFGV